MSLQTQLDKKLFRFKPIKIYQKKDCKDIISIDFGNSPTAEYYANVDQEYNEKSSTNTIYLLKKSIRKFLSYFIDPIFSKKCVEAEKTITRLAKNKLLLGVGGGPTRDYGETNLNIGPWENVDLISDAHSLPYKDNVVDHILCRAVLEHLTNPEAATKEFYRVLKNNSLLFIAVPFLQTYHGYPHHYRGITLTGLEQLVKDSGFTIIDSGTACGPCFALSSMIKEFLKNYLPLGKYISYAWKLSFGLILSKFDFFIINKYDSHKLAFGVFCLAKK